MADRPDSPLTWHGKPILTIALAAARYGVGHVAVRMGVARLGVAPVDPPPIDARTPAYWQAEFDEAWDNRVGRGANLRGHG